MEYSVFGAVRGQYGNYSWWVGEPLAYKYHPCNCTNHYKTESKCYRFDFRAIIVSFPLLRRLRCLSTELLWPFVPESVLHQPNLWVMPLYLRSPARNYWELYGFVNLMPLAGCDCQHDNIYMSKKIVCSLLRWVVQLYFWMHIKTTKRLFFFIV